MSTKFVLRHGETDKTIPYDEGGPSLTNEALLKTRLLGKQLRRQRVDLDRVAVSELTRSQESALALGAEELRVYSSLNEIGEEISEAELFEMLASGEVPEVALAAGEEFWAHPPVESLIVSHGLRIVGISAVRAMRQGLDLSKIDLFPKNLEVRKFDIPDL